MVKVNQELLDAIAINEVKALLDGIKDPDLRRNPAFLEKVRKFLKENNLQTTPETTGIQELKKVTEEIPEFDFEQ